ncbi:hypothetical protein HK19_01880 [Acetobacter persici]|nr:hypothetical protein HK19_01880 [Acetobacter persici]
MCGEQGTGKCAQQGPQRDHIEEKGIGNARLLGTINPEKAEKKGAARYSQNMPAQQGECCALQ